MDDATRHELGVLHARIEYLQFIVAGLVARMPNDERVGLGVELMLHFSDLPAKALNSTMPDSFVDEAQKYPPAQFAEADRRAQKLKSHSNQST